MFSIDQYPLPFAMDALAPHMSADTLHYHHDRHLATYIDNLNKLIDGTEYADMPLDEIIIKSAKNAADKKIFNNAAQVVNHDFFFKCLSPMGGGTIPVQIADAFGGADKFREQFKTAATGVFGSGWTWLVHDGHNIKIITTANAGTPITDGMRPLMVLDVWEHAYYLDWQNRRAAFVDTFLDNLVNWEFVTKQLAKIEK